MTGICDRCRDCVRLGCNEHETQTGPHIPTPDTRDPVTPLTAEEEENLRARWETNRMDFSYNAGRWLATLDAARGALNVALDRLAAYVLATENSDDAIDTTEDRDFIREARALQAAPVSIDVRTLIEAEHAIRWPDHPHDFTGPDPIFGDNECVCDAVHIAAEYDRLSHPDPVSGPSWDTETRRLVEQDGRPG